MLAHGMAPTRGSRDDELDRALVWSKLAAELFREALEVVQVGPYHIQSVLGEGASGTVYKAWDPRLERAVALKSLHVTQAEGHAQTLAEARLLAGIVHPNIVTVHAIEYYDGRSWIVMELVPGQTLTQWQDDTHHTRQQIIEVYLQAGEALVAAHDQRLVHRDIKPDNLRVGPDQRVCLLDFGLAQAEGLDCRGGTLAFAAPEQLRGEAAMPASDQFSFCAALFTALYKVPPYAGASIRERLDAIESGRLTPTSAPLDVPGAVASVLRRGLEGEADNRWPDMATLIQALAEAATTDPDLRRRRALLYRVDKFWLRGVLDPSLPGSTLFDVPMCLRDGAGPKRPFVPRSLSLTDFDGMGSVLITGPAGSGKTTILLRLVRDAAYRARLCELEPMPIVLGLGSWHRGHRTIREWAVEQIQRSYGVPPALSGPSFDSGHFALYLDGLDEVEARYQRACIDALEAHSQSSSAPLVVTARWTDEAALVELPRGMAHITVQAMSAEHLGKYARELFPNWPLPPQATDESPQFVTPLVAAILARIEAEQLPSAPSAPQNSSPANNDWSQLWTIYLDRMCPAQPDASSSPATKLRGFSSTLAQHMLRNHSPDFHVEDLQPSWLPSQRARNAHALIPAALASMGAASIPGGFMLATVGHKAALIAAGTTFLGCMVFLAKVVGLSTIRTVERLAWSWQHWRANATTAVKRAGKGACFSGAIAALIWSIPGDPAFALAILITQFCLWFMILSITFSFLGGLGTTPLQSRHRYNEGIWSSLANMVYVGGGICLALMLVLLAAVQCTPPFQAPPELIDGPPADLESWTTMTRMWRDDPKSFMHINLAFVAVAVAYPCALLRGGFAALQHLVLRLQLAAASVLPFRLERYLDMAALTEFCIESVAA